MSLPFLLGSEVDWVDELIGASFKVKNPNATSSLRLRRQLLGLMFAAAPNSTAALDAFERREWKRARRLLEEALQDEDRADRAAIISALLYWRGLGGAADKAAAVDAFARAADDGHARRADGVRHRASLRRRRRQG